MFDGDLLGSDKASVKFVRFGFGFGGGEGVQGGEGDGGINDGGDDIVLRV